MYPTRKRKEQTHHSVTYMLQKQNKNRGATFKQVENNNYNLSPFRLTFRFKHFSVGLLMNTFILICFPVTTLFI